MIIPVFRHEEWLVGALLLEIFGQTDSVVKKNGDFQSIIARTASAVTSSKKVLSSLISPPRDFQWASDEHRTLPLSPQSGWKHKTAVFSLKVHLFLQSFFMWKCRLQSCKAFTSLSIRAKMVDPFLPEISAQKWPTPFKNGEFQSIFTRSASAVIPSENSSIITNKKSTTSFQRAHEEQCTLPLSPQRGSRTKIDRFLPSKFDFSPKKSAKKFLCA